MLWNQGFEFKKLTNWQGLDRALGAGQISSKKFAKSFKGFWS
jgi:hypothetical protein